MSAPVTAACTFDTANRKKDKSVSMRFTTNLEVSSEDYMEMDKRVGSAGWLLWSPNELKLEDIPRHDAPTEERKSKAQRLRAVYFLLWRQKQADEDFETWYTRHFEAYMDKLKEKLDQ